ncbi:YbaB/EbfC family nucleoid-associated protein [Criibacterium bergeronii]|uniref:Nucleoid-associated protein BBG48_009965 n=1 Tax=Criibacterium bergeronii TaxID=1871336 RepID=A0A371IJ10_9FIRM|nr:YbaB/EbfC family nucleoid-associated protein [Criibacterium bergeronii]MBS6063337.1 YbaB/EbfC family nucleoid-associated protein [Peptostreptococcaceae bacterium]RDY20469.1 YbaB/EbfC family nucleoid-associated protein [Criibacterium bergeronii]
MAKRGFPGAMPGNMNNMMKQVQKMQKDMQKMQEEIAQKEVDATVGGGMVKVVANGKKEIVSISINKEAVDPDDVEMLEDMVLTAVNQALEKVDELTNSSLGSITGGLNLPGMF